MKTTLLAHLISVFGLSAHASIADGTSMLDFAVKPAGPGCVEFTNLQVGNGFPYHGLTSVITQIHFYFSQVSASDLSPASQSIAVTLSADGATFSPTQICSMPKGRWYVKYGLSNQNGRLVEFQNDFDPAKQTVDVN